MAVHKKYSKSVLGRGLDDLDRGRGLDALIDTGGVRTQGSSTINEVSVADIYPNADQPRRDFDESAMHELAASIREIGIIQPITVRQGSDGRYQIVAGERRWRAAQIVGLTTIPAYIRTIDDENIMAVALVENIQREDLNAIEIALAYQHLLEGEGMTQEKVAERVGKSRTAVANQLRLLRLPAQVQMSLQKREIEMGHARALLALDSPSMQIKLFNETRRNGYSVRKVEELAQAMKEGSTKTVKSHTPRQPDAYAALRKQLSDFLSTKVSLSCSSKGKGKITISFANEEELERIMSVFDRMKEQQT